MQIQGEEGKAKPVSIMTLEVTPQEAEKLTFASIRGRLRLVLRSSLNPEKVLTKGETYQSVLRSYRLKSGRASPKPKKRIVEVIKGSTTSIKIRFGHHYIIVVIGGALIWGFAKQTEPPPPPKPAF